MMIDRETRTITSTLNFVFKKTDNGSKLTCRNVHQTGQQNALQTLNVQCKSFIYSIILLYQKLTSKIIDQFCLKFYSRSNVDSFQFF